MIPIFLCTGDRRWTPERPEFKGGEPDHPTALSLKDSSDRTLSQVLWRGNIDEDGYIQEQI